MDKLDKFAQGLQESILEDAKKRYSENNIRRCEKEVFREGNPIMAKSKKS